MTRLDQIITHVVTELFNMPNTRNTHSYTIKYTSNGPTVILTFLGL